MRWKKYFFVEEMETHRCKNPEEEVIFGLCVGKIRINQIKEEYRSSDPGESALTYWILQIIS